MIKLIYIEIKKMFNINSFAFITLTFSVIISGLLLTNKSIENRNIEIFARNILNTMSEDITVDDVISDYQLDELLTYEEIEDLINKYNENKYEQYDAIMNHDFNQYNQLVYEYYNNTKFALILGKEEHEWGKIKDINTKCNRNILCLSDGLTSLNYNELAKYNLDNHIYIEEYKQASDYVFDLLSKISVIIIPLIGTLISYLTINQEHKECSNKTIWTLPFSKFKIFVSKTIATYTYALIIYSLIVCVVYFATGAISGFESSNRLITLYSDSLLLMKLEYSNRYMVLKQWQYNVIVFLFNCFSLYITVLIAHFISLLVKNKKLVFFATLICTIGTPLIIGEWLIMTLNRKYLFLLFPFYFVYTLVPYFTKWFSIKRNYFAIDIANTYYKVTNISMDTQLYVQDMNLCLGLIVGLITIIIVLFCVSKLLKRKDLV